MFASLLRLFNAVQTENVKPVDIDVDILKRTIRSGYILDPRIVPNPKLLKAIEEVVGISGEKANAAFHKSWATVRDSSMEDLVAQQIIHYITTYGFEALGIYDEDTVYIPHEKLKLPKVTTNIPLVVIKAMTREQVLVNIIVLANKIALSKTTLTDIMTVIKENGYVNGFVETIGNRELKSLLYTLYDMAPSDPLDFLRYVLVKLTEESLLIKNDYLIKKIKAADGDVLDKLLSKAPKNLATIFLRYKPLFLALKSISNNKGYFNRLRKQADSMHIPLPEDYMNSITTQLKTGKLDAGVLKQRLDKASIFRKIRLAYALNFRTHSKDSIIYKVRNGHGWVTDFVWNDKLNISTIGALNIVLGSIADEMRKTVAGKTFFIPANVHYTLPATEKQFVGNIPVNSYVVVPDDIIIGIHWTDDSKVPDKRDWGYGENRIDLDFSMIDASGKYGWDRLYRSESADILFSGDMTYAPKPNGASELFYMKRAQENPKLVMVNYFNCHDDVAPFKFFVAHEKAKNLDKDYVVDVNNILVSANMEVGEKQLTVALITFAEGENRVYFSSVGIADGITSRDNDITTKARDYLLASCKDNIDLSTVLFMAGAKLVSEKPEEGEYVDLSPEALDKTTIIKLLMP